MYLGAHMSISGGLFRAVERIRSVQGTALQVFTRNQRQWDPPPLEPKEIAAFALAREAWGDYPVVSHDSYLVNLAGTDADKVAKSVRAFTAELDRCAALDIPLLVTHPGSHLGRGPDRGIRAYVERLDHCLDNADTKQDDVTVLLETTAGQGSNLGATFEELGAIIQASKHPKRLGVCLDTCHAFAAGYELRTAEGLEQTLAALDRACGLDRLRLLHLNDSKHGLGSHRDRHEHIGRGELGVEAFRLILNHPALRGLPMVLETPKEEDLEDDRANLALLRSLVQDADTEAGA